MARYFYCPGETQLSGNTLVCSVAIEGYTPDSLVTEALSTFLPFVFYFVALVFAFSMIKKAIEM